MNTDEYATRKQLKFGLTAKKVYQLSTIYYEIPLSSFPCEIYNERFENFKCGNGMHHYYSGLRT